MLLLPYLVSTEPVWTFLLAMACLMVGLRSWDLFFDRTPRPVKHRLWHLLAFYDTRRAQPIPPRLDRDLLASTLGWLLLATLALGSCMASGRLPEPAHSLARYGGFVLLALGTFEWVTRAMRLVTELGGISPPPMHMSPHLSTSVKEFWGRRWNRIIGGWLRQNCYLPLARRGHRGLGVALAFTTSALLHAYLMGAAMGGYWAAVFGLFFLVQLGLMASERLVGVRAWPRPVARAWTWVAMVGSSPLFGEPMVRMFEQLFGLRSA